MTGPPNPIYVYHIVHTDRLHSIVNDGFLWSDEKVRIRNSSGTTVGMKNIKDRRLITHLDSHPGLAVGACVPFYFCPRSVMLYLLHRGNHAEITFQGGQAPIVHLVFDMNECISWANEHSLRWAFTLSNASSSYFEDRSQIANLHEINWQAITARKWSGNGVSRSIKEGKQAEFLVENRLPWELVKEIGVLNNAKGYEVARMLAPHHHKPTVKIMPEWYY